MMVVKYFHLITSLRILWAKMTKKTRMIYSMYKISEFSKKMGVFDLDEPPPAKKGAEMENANQPASILSNHTVLAVHIAQLIAAFIKLGRGS